mmetsp:Transcript_149392/g.286218  ORF Transcript_149392/g.286218 Transcript_149392/m.286218 type:complete len:230 (-) Transcript_149392:147-836(-)
MMIFKHTRRSLRVPVCSTNVTFCLMCSNQSLAFCIPMRSSTSLSIALLCSSPSPSGAPISKSAATRHSLSGLSPGREPSWMRLNSRVIRFCTARCSSCRPNARLPLSPSSLPPEPPPKTSLMCTTNRSVTPASRLRAPEGKLAADTSMNCTSSAAVKSGMFTCVGKRASNAGSILPTRAMPEGTPTSTTRVVLASALSRATTKSRNASLFSARASAPRIAKQPRLAAES